jgi:uncharacterized protein YbaR (Trm112 family)
MSGTVPGDLLEILVCPSCKGDLALQSSGAEHEALDCAPCGLRYPIEEGIPVMLVEEARRLDAPAHS